MKHLRRSDFEIMVKSLTDLQATYDDSALTFVLSYPDGETFESHSFYRVLLFIAFEFYFPKNQRANFLFAYSSGRCIATFCIKYTSKFFSFF